MIRRPAYAKINLTLDVVGKRGDGYHLLETVMQAVSLCDWVSAEKADGITVRCTDKAVPTDRRNTCHKAAEVFFGAAGIDGGVNVMIEKHIPSEAGLGGGSSDAAALLLILNELYGEPLDEKRLASRRKAAYRRGGEGRRGRALLRCRRAGGLPRNRRGHRSPVLSLVGKRRPDKAGFRDIYPGGLPDF